MQKPYPGLCHSLTRAQSHPTVKPTFTEHSTAFKLLPTHLVEGGWHGMPMCVCGGVAQRDTHNFTHIFKFRGLFLKHSRGCSSISRVIGQHAGGLGLASPHEPGEMAHVCNFRTQEVRQEDGEFKVILHYITSSRSSLGQIRPSLNFF